MADIFVTISVKAKDKLEATAIVNSKMQCSYCSEIVGVSTDNPYDIIEKYEEKYEKVCKY